MDLFPSQIGCMASGFNDTRTENGNRCASGENHTKSVALTIEQIFYFLLQSAMFKEPTIDIHAVTTKTVDNLLLSDATVLITYSHAARQLRFDKTRP